MRPITEIIIHCAATRPEWLGGCSLKAKIAEIRRWHVQGNGWKDIGYHFLIDRNGESGVGRPLTQVGAHTKGRNAGSIGICLIGGHGSAETDKFGQHFTRAQDLALRRLITELREQYSTIKLVTGHNQYAAKACPGFDVPGWLTAANSPAPSPPSNPLTALITAILNLFKGV